MAGFNPAIQSHKYETRKLALDGRFKAAHGEHSYFSFKK
jgi:hypothetical protein